MSLKRWSAKRDQNEAAIVRALEQAGALVLRLDVFDLLVWTRNGTLIMLDCKLPTGRATMAQEALIDAGWPLHYVRDEYEALRAIGAMK